MRTAVGIALFALVLAFVFVLVLDGGSARTAENEMVPFPVHRSQILRKEGTVYFVEGTITIPKGVEVSCQKDVHIKGKGKGATIRVEGSLQVHGVSAREVIFENVTVEPAAVVEDVHLDMCIFRDGGGVRTAEKAPANGKIFIEHVSFQAGTRLDVTMRGGSVDLSSSHAEEEVRLIAVDNAGKANKLKVKIRGCCELGTRGLFGGLTIRGAYDVTVRINHIRRGPVVLADCTKLIFDGNKVKTQTVELTQTRPGRFSKTKLQKCDFYCESVSVRSPFQKAQMDKVTVDKCWFNGIEKAKDVHEKVLRDNADDATNGARFHLKKINARPLELAGQIER